MVGLDVFEDFGFVWSDDEFAIVVNKGMVVENRVRLLDAATLKKPAPGVSRFLAVLPRREPDPMRLYYDIVFETSDARDIMAFVTAAENDGLWNETGLVPEERTFAFASTQISNPFADEQYGEWVGKTDLRWPGNSDGRALFVTDPAQRPWQAEYLRWRDERWPAPGPSTPVGP